MEPEQEIIESYRAGIGQYFPEQNPYTAVNVVMLSWAENDLHPEKEIESLSRLFRDFLHYEVSNFKIPGDGTQADQLYDQLRSSVRQLAKDALLIIYYAGHCDKDEKEHVRWAAFEKGGPTLSWHRAQQFLFDAACDVLLLLDCCNSALIATGVKESGKFEMIAACAKNFRTIGPSRRSFTRVLIKELKSHVDAGIYASQLADRIRENADITETPVFHNFVGKTHTSIMLKKVSEPIPEGYGKKPAGYMMMLVSLSDDPKGQEIADWLRTAAPNQVMGIDIEALILKARRLEGFDGSIFTPGSVLDRLNVAAKDEINRALRTLHTTMNVASKEATLHGDNSQAKKYLEEIQASTEAVCEAIETPVLQDLGQDCQEDARQLPCIVAADAEDSIALRQAVVDETDFEDGREIGREKLRFPQKGRRHIKLGEFEKKTVVVETFSYVGEECPPQTLRQVCRITGLLSRVKQARFCVLPCLGYFHDEVRHQLGLVFKFPPRCDSSSDLISLYEWYSKHKIVALGDRIRLAYALSRAIESFHRVGWVHKGIQSKNIVLYRKGNAGEHGVGTSLSGFATDTQGASTQSMSLDMDNPCLFGFGFARAADGETNLDEDHSLANNLYRHPDRWGQPRLRFEKVHDIYSLGIVMYEVAVWKDIQGSLKINDADPSGRINATEVRKMVQTKCNSDLPHRVGDTVAQSILACIDFTALTKGMNEYESQRFFQQQVSNKIGQLVGKV
ncbi:hypothetical protein GGS24DRAFT_437941 [Hypoxylon argillaceum]|nr:hypothetical protein GGS24DRAFT_437941 [Hypoxylon argillaceum]